ncbi:RpiB/LacA/LacB family sugar-phosphate isomerase [Bacillus sp. SL00103]
MKVAIASDHGGTNIREEIKQLMDELKIEPLIWVVNVDQVLQTTQIIFPVANMVVNGEVDRGILICGTGIGMSISANKVKGIQRWRMIHFSAKATREHNDTNVLAMGERVIGPGLAREIAHIWLTTEFTAGRHAVRIGKIVEYEEKHL